MDISKQYIKMCDCLEIQEKEFDYRPNFHFAYFLDGQWKIEHDFLGGQEPPVWLPRQDQIQEMLDEPRDAPYLITRLNNWRWDHNSEWILNISMDQFLLAFYMWEKYRKIWDEENWIKKGGGKSNAVSE